MAVVNLYTVPACKSQTTTVRWHEQDEKHQRHRVVSCTCGWEIWTMADTRADISVTHVEAEVHRQVAGHFGWNHPRERIIAWVQ